MKIINVDKFIKNYLRDELLYIGKEADGKPFVISGKYKHSPDSYWCTFTCIRPFIEGFHTFTIADHVNIKRLDTEEYYDLSSTYNNRKFYLVVHSYEYISNGKKRQGVFLSKDQAYPALILTDDFPLYKSRLLNTTYCYDKNRYCKP